MEPQRKPDGTFAPGHTFSKGPRLRVFGEFSDGLRECIRKTLLSPPSYLEEIKQNPKATLMEVIVAKFTFEAAKGSERHLNVLLERCIGKPKDAVEQTYEEREEFIEMIPREKLLEVVSAHYDSARAKHSGSTPT